MLDIDHVAQMIPLIIDYILDYNKAEIKILSHILQLDENCVRKALKILEKHGILECQYFKKEHFDEKIAKTLGISNLSDFNFEDNINSID